MLEIIFTACLLLQPATCQDFRISGHLFEAENPIACQVEAQRMMAIYMQEHKGWYVAKYGCRRADTQRI